MTNDYLYHELSPEAYTHLREGMKRQAEQERRAAIERFGEAAWQHLLALSRRRPRQRLPKLRAQGGLVCPR